MRRPGRAGAARPPAIALLRLAFSGSRRANVHPGESSDRLQLRQNKEGFPLCKVKLVIVANVADYWGGFTVRSVPHTCVETLRQTTKVMRLCVWGEQINTISQGQCAHAGRLRGLSPAVQSFNKSDTVTWGNCLIAVSWVGFSTVWVGGLMQQGRDGTLMYVAANGCFCRTTNTFLNTSPGKYQIRPCCIFTQCL